MATDPSEWLRSLPWTHVALALSAGLNLVLLLALFSRRAINGILVNLYSTWRDRTEGRRHILRELYAKMDTVNHDYLFALVTASMVHGALTDSHRQVLLDQQHAIAPRLEAAQSFLAEHELELPQDLRHLAERLRAEMILPATQGTTDVSVMLRHSEAVTRVTRAIKTAVSRHMHGSLWPRIRMIRRDGQIPKI
jgi:hypothetical protein